MHDRPSRSESIWFIGLNSDGHWVVRDEDALNGGVFIERRDAIRFALVESRKRPLTLLMLPEVMEAGIPLTSCGSSGGPLHAKSTALAA